MMNLQHEWEWVDEFFGGGIFGATASENDPWVITDTSSAGTPTYTRLDHGESTGAFAPGVAQLAFDSQAEAQNVCLSFGDTLPFDIDKLRTFECRVRQGQATADAATSIAVGVAGDRNDAIDTIAIAALFRIIGSNSIVVETDDGTTNNDDVATGKSLSTTWVYFKIDFTDLTDVKFYIDDGGGLVQVATGTTFDMSAYDAGLQPYFQLQKTSDANEDAVEIDFIRVSGVR